MIYQTKEIKLKDGRTAVLRAPTEEDCDETIAYLRQAAGETEYLANYPEELNYTHESEREYLRASRESNTRMILHCTVDGRIAGNCQIMFMRSMKTKHRAAVAIALLREYCGLGIGTAMFEELIAEAKRQGVQQLELEVIEGNTRALALYRKMGFAVVGQIPDAFRFKDGSSHAAIFMTRQL